MPTEQFLSEAAQQGIAFFVMAVAIIGLCAYLKVLDDRADDRAKAEAARIEAQNQREDKRLELADKRYQDIINQVMDQQKTMMNLCFQVINRNSTVQETMVETLKNGTTNPIPAE